MNKRLLIPSILHFFVDFFSAFSLISFSNNDQIEYIAILIYGIFAFLTQPIIGAIIEHNKHNKMLIGLSSLIVLIGSFSYYKILIAIICGLGNSLFHVSSGKLVLEKSQKSFPLGVFISFGAIGIGLSYLSNSIINYLAIIFLVVFVLFIILNHYVDYEKINFSFNENTKEHKNKISLLCIICLSVLLRGFLGRYNVFSWTNDIAESVLVIHIAMFLGKFLGGLILDKFGKYPLIFISFFLSMFSSLFNNNVSLSLLGIFGINLLMAFTLDFARKASRKNMTFSFGLLASCLLFGNYFGSFVLSLGYYKYIGIILNISNAILLLVVCLYNKKGGAKSANI